MPNLYKKDFSQGWVPSADTVNAPPNALLRMDNCVLDEQGAVAIRRGCQRLTTNALGGSVTNIYTANINGTKLRMASAGTSVYSNESAIDSGYLGTGVSFGDYLGQIFFAWSTKKMKWDGTTLRFWGIAKPSNAPTMALVNPVSFDLADWDISNAAKVTIDEGTSSYISAPDSFGTTLALTPSSSTNRGTASYLFTTTKNANLFSDGGAGLPEDQFKIWLNVYNPENLKSITIMLDCNDGHFDKDWFAYTIPGRSQLPANTPYPSGVPPIGTPYFDPGVITDPYLQQQILGQLPQQNVAVPLLKPSPGGSSGAVSDIWQQISFPRSLFTRVGTTPGKGWDTIAAQRIVVEGSSTVAVWYSQFFGGSHSPLSGTYTYMFILVRDDGTYQALSPYSDISAPFTVTNNSVGVTVTYTGADSQANRIWLYRMGGSLDRFLRVADVAVTSSPQVITDTLGDRDALIQDIEAPPDSLGPPNDIVDIEGPYYDRLFCLTQTLLWPSLRREPENYAPGQAILVADKGEVALWIKKAYGGLYIGTTKDIYRIDGDGSEYPDGIINFRKTPLNIGNPPVGSNCVIAEGNFLVYMSADGWRAFTGSDSIRLADDIDLLFKGMARDGVQPLNVSDFSNTGCRYWGAVAHGQMWAMMPEGTNANSTPTIYRYDFIRKRWYRHIYPFSIHSIYREPNGGVLVGSTGGHLYLLEQGTTDDGTAIPYVLDTPLYDCDMPMKLKDPWNWQSRMQTGTDTCTVTFYGDSRDPNVDAADITLAFVQQNEGIAFSHIDNLVGFVQTRIRFAGVSSTAFRLLDFMLEFRERPQIEYFNETKPVVRSVVRRRFGGFNLMINTFGQACTITPVLDDIDQTPFVISSSDVLSRPLIMPTVVGRDLWARVERLNGFELYLIEPIVIEELPILMRGQVPYTSVGYPCDKVLSGIHFRVCTLGQARMFTPILDGVDQPPFMLQTSLNEADDYIHNFPAPMTAEQIAWSVDCEIELYEWEPEVMYTIPCPRRVWDTGPVDMGGQDLSWIRYVRVKCKSPVPIEVACYFDGVLFPTITSVVDPGIISVYTAWAGREYKGRQPRIVVTAGGEEFNPYWVEFWFRPTGTVTEKKPFRLNCDYKQVKQQSIPTSFQGT